MRACVRTEGGVLPSIRVGVRNFSWSQTHVYLWKWTYISKSAWSNNTTNTDWRFIRGIWKKNMSFKKIWAICALLPPTERALNEQTGHGGTVSRNYFQKRFPLSNCCCCCCSYCQVAANGIAFIFLLHPVAIVVGVWAQTHAIKNKSDSVGSPDSCK